MIKYSQYTEYCFDKELEVLCRQYKKHFESHQSDGKNKVIDCFKRKEFEKIPQIIAAQGEGSKQPFFAQCADMSLLQLNLYKNSTNI